MEFMLNVAGQVDEYMDGGGDWTGGNEAVITWFVFVFCVSVYSCVRTYVCALRRSLRFAWGLWSVFWGLTGFDCWGDRWCSVLSSKRTHRDPFTDLSRRRRYVDGEIDSSIGSGVRAYVRT